jgi:hypothetical protein
MKLVFVYNANEGLFNAVTDSIHKILSPSTYECRLCYYTHGLARMRKPWKQFLESLDQPMAFFHRNEFWRDYHRHDIELPSILVESDGKLEVLLAREDIEKCEDLDALISKISTALQQLTPVATNTR